MNTGDELRIQAALERQLARSVWKDFPISEENMDLIREFDDYNVARQVAWTTRLHYAKAVKAAAALLSKPLKDVTKKDMIAFIGKYSKNHADKTVNNVKIATKRFYQWLYDIEEGYPEVVKWMKPKPTRNLIQPEQLVTPEEVKRLLAACRCQRDRALVLLFYERGPRPHEVLAMKVGDVKVNRYGVQIMVDGKTGGRPLPCLDSAPDISLWLQQHPLRDDPGAPLWVNVKGKEIKPLLYDGLKGVFRRLVKRAGIKKRLWPYLLRHTSLTGTSKEVPESTLRRLAGWSPTSKMPSVYIHLNGSDVEAALLKARGIEVDLEKEPRLAARACPRCKTQNPPDSKFCLNCSLALDVETAMKIQQRKEHANDLMTKLFKDPEFRELVKKKLKELA